MATRRARNIQGFVDSKGRFHPIRSGDEAYGSIGAAYSDRLERALTGRPAKKKAKKKTKAKAKKITRKRAKNPLSMKWKIVKARRLANGKIQLAIPQR
jgi:hypothetical protein